MRQLVRSPKTQLGILLFSIFLTAFVNNPLLKIVFLYLLLHLSAALSDFVFLKIKGIPLSFPSAALVSASIITLVVNPNLPWHQFFVIAVLAIASKNFLRVSGRHIFNPAGFGLFAGSLMFPDAISWWGTSFQQFRVQNLEFIIYFLILLSPGLISIVRMRRHRIILSFLIVYFLLNLISNFKFQISNFFDPTLLFFSLVMLPEPMTTPNRHYQQILFGVFIAFFSVLISSPISNFEADPLITSLLIGNLIFFKFR
ncbi:MAG: RnfABCDGE type electron transport complex subunit D [Candidatus Levybacteria bacterium]|nr:RnfABCDGE type electron transport complex subunit D [Candidatus Levybacteria bacterium]